MGTKRTLTRIDGDSGSSMRDLEARRRILSVTHQMLVTQGYARMTIGGVAANAGVGKATIYRTWPNKPALTLDALRERLPKVPTADLGDSRAEMLATAGTLASLFGLSEVRSALPGLIADSAGSPDLERSLQDKLIGERKKLSARCLQRAIERGVLPPDTDVSMILDSWAGLMLFRCVFFSQVLDKSDVERLVDTTLAAPLQRSA
ncbi:TetR/AcrR family transcriptional regulator [Streptomyces sp. AV19]|uniref:TetR/AcrR family transcriptional regulator n=1 Tax=Streptomyces sp. AV19 TaxID=2793068 RepID=UPI0018FE727B|nr:TetR/AcrR family transcriptional regulator [Streptomyces sp. AV19]MBH1933797.1 TetR/AcrR family transcriptional regulator [Streptomyces sp. AV19]MDG4535698.1 TetR/AcrR family transcriptional regulator [Streptomyces sp. AV19]